MIRIEIRQHQDNIKTTSSNNVSETFFTYPCKIHIFHWTHFGPLVIDTIEKQGNLFGFGNDIGNDPNNGCFNRRRLHCLQKQFAYEHCAAVNYFCLHVLLYLLSVQCFQYRQLQISLGKCLKLFEVLSRKFCLDEILYLSDFVKFTIKTIERVGISTLCVILNRCRNVDKQ